MTPLRAAAFAMLASACAPGLSEPERFEVAAGACDFDVPRELLAPRCGRDGCHVPYEPAAGLELVTGGLAERLIGHESSTCVGALLIDPEDPSASFLLERLGEEPDCDGAPVDRMPFIGAYLEPHELDCVARWVDSVVAHPIPDAGWYLPDAGPPPPDGATPPRPPLVLQAEEMTLSGYVVDPGNATLIRLPDATPMGTATAAYAGEPGAYTMATVHVIAEIDGEPRIQLVIDGETALLETLPLSSMDMQAMAIGPAPITLRAGSTIEVRGYSDGSAWARVDRVELTP